jgi:hypothetical protein
LRRDSGVIADRRKPDLCHLGDLAGIDLCFTV